MEIKGLAEGTGSGGSVSGEGASVWGHPWAWGQQLRPCSSSHARAANRHPWVLPRGHPHGQDGLGGGLWGHPKQGPAPPQAPWAERGGRRAESLLGPGTGSCRGEGSHKQRTLPSTPAPSHPFTRTSQPAGLGQGRAGRGRPVGFPGDSPPSWHPSAAPPAVGASSPRPEQPRRVD